MRHGCRVFDPIPELNYVRAAFLVAELQFATFFTFPRHALRFFAFAFPRFDQTFGLFAFAKPRLDPAFAADRRTALGGLSSGREREDEGGGAKTEQGEAASRIAWVSAHSLEHEASPRPTLTS
jgi:hypothetical protein